MFKLSVVLGMCVLLVWTGLALAWRRLLAALPVVGWRAQKDPPYVERA